MKVIKTLSIINFFIFVTFNIKNESKYSNTFINNAYNMSIRRSMPNQANKETQNNSNVQQDSQTKSNVPPTQDADTKSPTAQPEQAENSAPTAEQTESPELQSAPENKGTGQHGHMHGSRNNHPQNTSDSQKECTDGNKENCGAATSLLNNSSNIASINKFVVLISATLVLSFAIFI
ncbi:merozoite surface antigen 2 [Plasmodium falciparum Tanzania (2000708)]|uniref:Merozoite surface protein 2 n=1 Tax=Plasmodium falciparum Tanzania (2000708) TaxID=1036725 RepID=A0A024WDT4_PLAFA|nr:merozoite surface antigen 2 [Plasmodium falciparum Tanzania (2000708)]